MNRARDPLDRHLGALRPETASAGFTDRVMKRIEQASAEHSSPGSWRSWRSWRPWRWAGAAAVLVAAVGLVLSTRSAPPESNTPESRAVRLAEMRRQHALLEQELATLRSRAQDTAPVIYLGSVDEVDYVWDLSPLLDRRTGQNLPASTRQSSAPRFSKELP